MDESEAKNIAADYELLQYLLHCQYTLDFGLAGIDPPLIPTVNVPGLMSWPILETLLEQHKEAPFVTTWHRGSDGEVEVRCKSREGGFDVGEWAGRYFNGAGSPTYASFYIDCQTVSL